MSATRVVSKKHAQPLKQRRVYTSCIVFLEKSNTLHFICQNNQSLHLYQDKQCKSLLFSRKAKLLFCFEKEQASHGFHCKGQHMALIAQSNICLPLKKESVDCLDKEKRSWIVLIKEALIVLTKKSVR